MTSHLPRPTVLMTLGNFRFSLSTAAYQQLRRAVEYRWPVQDRAGRRPARQFTGIGDETIELEGAIYPYYRGGLEQIEAMRSLAGLGEPLMLTDGTGKVWGKFCILRIEETQTLFHGDGTPRKQEFRLGLGRYGEDG